MIERLDNFNFSEKQMLSFEHFNEKKWISELKELQFIKRNKDDNQLFWDQFEGLLNN